MKKLLVMVTLILALFATSAVKAQNNETTLTGTVSDTTGAIVANASVTVVNADTNARREARTTSAGTYYVGNLPIGHYNLTVTALNFETEQVNAIELVVGQTRKIDVRLNIGAVAQEIQVEDTAPALATTTAEIGGVIQNQQIKNLPLNGRNISSLLALVPGAIDSGGASITSIRFAGRGNDDSNFRLDGVDATGISHQGTNASLRLQISTEAIAEFKVATLLYGADTGGSAGGQVELVSQTGTNQFHGAVFDFLRNNYFDSKGPFDTVTPNLKFNDFGTSLGGPIWKNRAFFFASYEGLRQNVGQTLKATVPTDAFRTQVLSTSPALAPFIDTYPHGNGPINGSVGVFYNHSALTQNVEDSYLIRGQHQFNDKNSIVVRYNIDHATITGPSAQLFDQSVTATSPMNATVQYTHVLTPTLLNEARVGFNRAWATSSTIGSLTASTGIAYAISIGGGISGLTNTKVSEAAPSTYSFLDDLTKTLGRHTFKTGIELKEVHFNYSQAGVHQLAYNTSGAFQNNLLDSVSVVADVPVHGLHKLETFAYIQDQYKLRSNLTLIYGLRYEFFNVLHEVHGRSRAWDDVTCGGNCPVGGLFTIPVTNNIEPRFSFGWQPKRFNNNIVFRGGAGVYHGEAQIGDLNAPSDNFATLFGLLPATFPGLSWPVDPYVALAAQNPSAVQPRGLARKRQDPRVTQYGLQVQAVLPFRFILDTGYVGSWGDHQFTRTYKNNYIIGTTTRPYPGSVKWITKMPSARQSSTVGKPHCSATSDPASGCRSTICSHNLRTTELREAESPTTQIM
jgi:hypothetical protein